MTPVVSLSRRVDDAGAAHAADARQALAAMGDQGVDQRPGPVAGGRMDDEILGLVDDDEVVVLVEDGERDRFALRYRGRPAAARPTRTLSPALTRWLGIADRLVPDGDLAGENQDLQGASATGRRSTPPGRGRASRPPDRPRTSTSTVSINSSAMIHPPADDDEKPLDPTQARLVARMRRFMWISGFATVLGVAVGDRRDRLPVFCAPREGWRRPRWSPSSPEGRG